MDKSKASKKQRVNRALSQLIHEIEDSSDDEDLAAGSQRRLARTPSPRRAPTTPPSRWATYQPDPTAASTQPALSSCWTSTQPALPSCWASTQPAPLPERWATYTSDYTTPSTWPPALPPSSPVGSIGQSSSAQTPWSPTSYSPPRVSKNGKEKRKALQQTANMGVPHRVKGEEPEVVAVDKSANRRPSKKAFKVSQKCIVL